MKGQITRHEWVMPTEGGILKKCIHCECIMFPPMPYTNTYKYWPVGTVSYVTKSPKCITRKKPEDGTTN
jgi:hypothetical protein